MTRKLSEALNLFSSCIHVQQSIWNGCRITLAQIVCSPREILSPAGKVPLATSTVALNGELKLLRQIAWSFAKIIDVALPKRERYCKLFEKNQADDIRMYNCNRKDVLDWKIVEMENSHMRNILESSFKADRKRLHYLNLTLQ